MYRNFLRTLYLCNSFNPHNYSVKEILLLPSFARMDQTGTERWSHPAGEQESQDSNAAIFSGYVCHDEKRIRKYCSILVYYSCLIKWVEDWERLIGCFGAHEWSKIKQYQYQGGEDEVENKEMVVVKVKRKTGWQKVQQC